MRTLLITARSVRRALLGVGGVLCVAGVGSSCNLDPVHRSGVNNLGEEALGSDPTDARSNLRLAISDRREVVLLEWDSVEDRIYTIEVSKELGRFEAWKEGIRATPPLNSFELDRQELGEVRFFRIRLDAPPVQ